MNTQDWINILLSAAVVALALAQLKTQKILSLMGDNISKLYGHAGKLMDWELKRLEGELAEINRHPPPKAETTTPHH